ncbi:MAG: hypothetical protein O7G84_19825 [Gammaproteobacteria bacterium]|nr:hypothetical protein [Gammaproteobacteria bacterium]
MNKNDRLRDEDPLEWPLRDAVDAVCAEPISDELIERVIARASQLPSSTAERAESLRPDRRGRGFHRRRWIVMAASCSAVLLVAAVLWYSSANSVLADVAKAVAKRPWMHTAGKGPNGREIEMWYSARHGIIAMRQGKEAIFIDMHQETMERYSVASGGASFLSRRLLESEWKKRASSNERVLQTLFFGDPEKSFRDGPYELISHTQETVQVNDATLIEYRFTTSTSGADEPMVTVLRVDPSSQLPVTWGITYGKTKVLSYYQIDFPADGPQTIYSLGVPRDVEVVDPMPSDELKPILAAWQKGRTRFDSYRAVVVSGSFPGHRSGGNQFWQVWRKGLKWRVELLRAPPNLRRYHVEGLVPDDADPKMWWRSRGQEWEKTPKIVSNGAVEIRLKPVYAQPGQADPKNPRYKLIRSLEPHRTHAFTADSFTEVNDPRPDDMNVMVEFHAYPFWLGREGWSYETTVDPMPENGPEGTVLVETLKKGLSERSEERRGVRHWVDPSRGYVVTQVQWLWTGEQNESNRGMVEVLELGVSPSGLSYPVVVRQVENVVPLGTGGKSDTYLRFYVDFDAEVPDELFEVSKWGPIK